MVDRYRIRRKPVPVYQDAVNSVGDQNKSRKPQKSADTKTVLQQVAANTVMHKASFSKPKDALELSKCRSVPGHVLATKGNEQETNKSTSRSSLVDADATIDLAANSHQDFDPANELDLTLLSFDDELTSGRLSRSSTVLDLCSSPDATVSSASFTMSTPPSQQTAARSQRASMQPELLPPLILETCPTPLGTVRGSTSEQSSRKRSLIAPIGYGTHARRDSLNVADGIASLDLTNDDQEILVEDTTLAGNRDLMNEHCWLSSGLDSSFTNSLPAGNPLRSTISYPSRMSLSSVLNSQVELPNPSSSRRSSSIESHTPLYTRPVTPTEELGSKPRRHSPVSQESSFAHAYLDLTTTTAAVEFDPKSTRRDLRAQPSQATLFSWDLSHLPAPQTPRERPYKVGLLTLLLPTIALGGGRGSGRFGDTYGPVERRTKHSSAHSESLQEFSDLRLPRQDLQRKSSLKAAGGGLARGLSRRGTALRRSMGLASTAVQEGVEGEEAEGLQDWITIVVR
ncbi:hypothetical protein OIO90_001068 [Microbotryomycetes sp. JL221]|nr:hypothetical protein OIO90_001068 [Microbotryomycetes sp. JL221]